MPNDTLCTHEHGQHAAAFRNAILHMARSRRLLVVLAFFVALMGISTVYRAAYDEIQRTDYTVYLAAGQAVLDGSDLYAAHNVRGWNYVYPPTFAILLAPAALLPPALGSLIWYLLEIIAILLTSAMAVALIGQGDGHRQRLLLVLPWLSLCTLLVSGITRCQASEFMVFLVTAACYFHFSRRPIAAGASLAAATLLKAFPASLAFYFLLRRQWKFLFAFMLVLLLLGFVLPVAVRGLHTTLHDYQRWTEVVAGPALQENSARAGETPVFRQLLDARKSRNQSLEALFLGLEPFAAGARLWAVIAGSLMALAMANVARRRLDCRRELALLSAFLVWMLLIPPISETHYFGVLILPLTVLLADVFRPGWSPTKSWRRGLPIIVPMIAVMAMLPFRTTELARPLCIASLALWGILLKIAADRGRADTAATPDAMTG